MALSSLNYSVASSYSQCIGALEYENKPVAPGFENGTLWCNATWDTFFCWPAIPANSSYSLPCPPFRGLSPEKLVTKHCHESGRWSGKNEGDFSSSSGYTNYITCFLLDLSAFETDKQVKSNAHKVEFAGRTLFLMNLITTIGIFSTFNIGESYVLLYGVLSTMTFGSRWVSRSNDAQHVAVSNFIRNYVLELFYWPPVYFATRLIAVAIIFIMMKRLFIWIYDKYTEWRSQHAETLLARAEPPELVSAAEISYDGYSHRDSISDKSHKSQRHKSDRFHKCIDCVGKMGGKCINIRWNHPVKESAYVMGTFLRDGAMVQLKLEHGHHCALVNMPVGHHEFKFLIDGKWRVSRMYNKCLDIFGEETNFLHVVAPASTTANPLNQ